MTHVCSPCVFVLETEETALRMLDRALELVITVIINSDALGAGRLTRRNDPRCTFYRQRELAKLAGQLRRCLHGYITAVSKERIDRQLAPPDPNDIPF